MQVIADTDELPHMFLLGLRAPPGGFGPTAEKVGVFVYKQTIDTVGGLAGNNPVLVKDEPYAGAPADGPFLFESDLATSKPYLDVVVVRSLADDQTGFGHININRGGGFGMNHGLNYGWWSRVDEDSPAGNSRTALAGVNLDNFIATGANLPDQFSNGFFNGQPIAGEDHLGEGDVVRFTNTNSGVVKSVRMTSPPDLAITQQGQPVSPPVTISLSVDTLVYNENLFEFLVIWRAVFLWEDRLASASLEVNQ